VILTLWLRILTKKGYCRRCQKTYTIFSLIPATACIAERVNIVKIAWAFEVFPTNYFEYGMNDVIFQDWISQICFNEFSIYCVCWSTWFYAFWYFYSFEPIVKRLIKYFINFEIMTSFRTPTQFLILNE
jgi:hypothetical protein